MFRTIKPCRPGDQEAFFANNALRFINSNGNVQTGRYPILPVGGTHFLDEQPQNPGLPTSSAKV